MEIDEKKWLMTPPNEWKSEEVVDVMIKVGDIMSDYDVSEGLSVLDELIFNLRAEIKGLNYRIADLEELVARLDAGEKI